MPNKKQPLGLYVKFKEDRDYGSVPSARFSVYVVRIEDEDGVTKIRNVSTSYEPGHEFYNLEIGAFLRANSKSPFDQAYGYSTEFRDVYSIDAASAKNMVKVLTALNKKLDKLENAWGYSPQTFADYVLRVATSLGISKFVMPTTEAGPGWWGYDDRQHKVLPIGAIGPYLTKTEADFYAKHSATAKKEA